MEDTKACCAYHAKEYLYLCKCKKLWADDQEWLDHAWEKHYGDRAGWIRVPSKFYTHGDNAQMVARKLLLQKVDITA